MNLVVLAMNITLKNLKIARHLSEETTAFTATIYVDGMSVGHVKNDGQGGSNSYGLTREWEEKLEAHAKSLPDLQSEYGPLKMDLDLLIDNPHELPLAAIAELREAFAESNLPFSVDLLERRNASPEFLSRIEDEGMVELNPQPAEHP